jgi:cytochrome c oxidase cbb3-type subunit 3
VPENTTVVPISYNTVWAILGRGPDSPLRLNRLNKLAIACASLLVTTTLLTSHTAAQTSPSTPATPPPGAQAPGIQNNPPPNEPAHRGGFVPGQKRETEDPAQIARGKLIFGINCRGCHGADLRGGDLGGPNLLRSQVALSDRHGELIVPIIHGSRQNMGMPAIGLNDADANAAASYVRSVIESIQVQGAPPSAGQEAPNIVIGNANEGKDYFATKCGTCHSVTGDLGKIAARIPDPKKLQNAWIAGGRDEEQEDDATSSGRAVMATVTLPSGESVQGKLVRIDDFLLTVMSADGSEKTFRRNGDQPKVEIHDPRKAHRDLLPQYDDKDIHNVTAYLATLK